jgi:hypothetical protein
MATWFFEINYGTGWVDITNLVLVKSIQRKRQLWNSLAPTINSMTFDIDRDVALFNALLSADGDILIHVEKDDDDYFTGQLLYNFDLEIKYNIGQLKIDCVDNGARLHKKFIQSYNWLDYKVCDSANPTTSIIHSILTIAGYTIGEIDVVDINKSIDYFLIRANNDSYFELLKSILFEYGYVFYHNNSGQFCIYEWSPASISTSKYFSNTAIAHNMIDTLKITAKQIDINAINISWWEHIRATVLTPIFSETAGSDDAVAISHHYPCYVKISGGDYYPEGAEDNDVYISYQCFENVTKNTYVDEFEAGHWENSTGSFFGLFDFPQLTWVGDRTVRRLKTYQAMEAVAGEVICVPDIVTFTVQGTSITLQTSVNEFTRAKIKIKNTALADHYMTKFLIEGFPVKRGDTKLKMRSTPPGDKLFELKAAYIVTDSDAEKLCCGLERYFRFSPDSYACLSEEDWEPGDFVYIDDDTLGINNLCVIVAREDYEYIGNSKYIMEGMAPYTVDTTTRINTHTSPVPIPVSAITGGPNLVSFIDLANGYIAEGDTTDPDQVTINVCQACGKNGILLEWDRQTNLTNFDHYEIQVSDDDATWYALRFDGVDWKGTINTVTEWRTEMCVHSDIPPITTGAYSLDNPAGRPMYYHVRRVTKVPDLGAYSATATATTRLVGAGDVAANSIYANNIIASEIVALLIKTSTLYVGYNSSTGGTVLVPHEGDTVTYLSGVTISFLEYTGGAWVSTNGIVLMLAIAGLMCNMVGCGGIYSPGNPPTDTETLPSPFFRVFNFENNYQDQFGVDDWAADLYIICSTTQKKFGTRSLYNDGSNTTIQKHTTTVFTCGESQAVACWCYIDFQAAYTKEIISMIFSANDSIKLFYNGSTSLFTLQFKQNTTILSISSDSVTGAAWNYIGFTYNKTTNIAYLVINNKIYVLTLAGTFGASVGTYTFFYTKWYETGNKELTCYLDELLFYQNKYLNPNLLAQHYTHNVPWVTTRSKADIYLRPDTDGRLLTDGALKINAAASPFYDPLGAGTIGTPHPTALTTGVLDPANTNVTECTTFAGLPANCYVLCNIQIGTSTNNILYLWQDAGGTIPAVGTSDGYIFANQVNTYITRGHFWIKLNAAGKFWWQVNTVSVSVLNFVGIMYII